MDLGREEKNWRRDVEGSAGAAQVMERWSEEDALMRGRRYDQCI